MFASNVPEDQCGRQGSELSWERELEELRGQSRRMRKAGGTAQKEEELKEGELKEGELQEHN